LVAAEQESPKVVILLEINVREKFGNFSGVLFLALLMISPIWLRSFVTGKLDSH